ncbi:MAG: HD domain-containing protein [Nitrospirae bacterium]|nr:HD domain-containing protein [Nitrospirota bacterium]MCL5259631.1 HD domain-containing protein [Nitrospirota bacterium]
MPPFPPMDSFPVHPEDPFHGISLFSDPVHGYIRFVSSPSDKSGTSEADLIDSPWIQRLRSIFQLQSARLVFPSAEHSRFVHSLGAMHIAGRFALHLYPSFSRSYPGLLSPPLFEELLRVSALLHDIGHGPFCHFFDEHVLNPKFALSHERLGQILIRGPLREIIEGIDRSPSAPFTPGERLSADWVAYLIGKGSGPNPVPSDMPQLATLKPLFSGLFTVDNLDYVLRDSYMCGVAIGPVDLERLLYYAHIREGKLALHRSGLGAFEMFVTARAFMYRQIYFHRTTRLFDMALRDLIGETMDVWGLVDPVENLSVYQELTDQSLLETVRRWRDSSDAAKSDLGNRWRRFLERKKEWRLVYEKEDVQTTIFGPPDQIGQDLEERIGAWGERASFRVDVAYRDNRPENPWNLGDRQILIYDPLSGKLVQDPLAEMLERLPVRQLAVRVFARPEQVDLGLIQRVRRYFEKEPAK